MTNRRIKKFCQIDEASQKLLELAIDKFGLSARAYAKVLKVPRTIACLETQDSIQPLHLSEAIQYRSLDRNLIAKIIDFLDANRGGVIVEEADRDDDSRRMGSDVRVLNLE
jgi:hypothetical protein